MINLKRRTVAFIAPQPCRTQFLNTTSDTTDPSQLSMCKARGYVAVNLKISDKINIAIAQPAPLSYLTVEHLCTLCRPQRTPKH
jgi:hypothetical protein